MSQYGWRDGKLSAKKVIVEDGIVMQYIIPKTVAYSTGDILGGYDFNAASAAITNVLLELQPPYPMNLVVCANVAGTAGGNDILTISGEDQFGNAITEDFTVKSTAAATTAGSKAFGKIDGIAIKQGQSSANTTIKSSNLGFGWNNVVGLPWPIASSGDIISYAYDGAYATTAVDFLTFDGTYNTLTLPTMAASKVVSVIYKTKLQKKETN